ncbi:MAG: PAS domain S-box protein [Burkholderiaceae bacterium]|jgi:PAS domain S-box-containing protein
MTIQRRVLIALGVAVVCLIALALVAAKHYSELLEAQDWTLHTYEVLAELNQLKFQLDRDRGSAYCAVSGSHDFIYRQYDPGEYEAHYRKLLDLVRDNPDQVGLLAELDAAWGRWNDQYLVPLEAACALAPGVTHPSTPELNRLGVLGGVLRGAAAEKLDAMTDVERKLAAGRESRETALEQQTADWLIALGILSAVLALLTCSSLVRAAALQDQSQRSLEGEIEQRRAVEKLLMNSESRVRSVLDNVPDAIITIDQRGIIESFNPSAEAMFGYLAEDVIGRSVSVLMPEPYRAQHNDFMENYARSGQSRIIGKRRELSGQRADGSRFAMDLAVTETVIDGEKLFTGILRDVSEKKRQDTEIHRFKASLDNTLDIIFMCDPVTLRFRYVNRGAKQALGYTEEELLQMRASDLTPALPEHVFRSHVAQLLSGERDWLSYETVQRRSDGSELPTEVFLQLVQDNPTDPGLFIGIARDLTERRRVDRLKSEFISVVSHELRTPLTSIRGSLGLLVGGVAGELPERARRMVEIAHHNSERLVRLINDMLDMEKIESGKMRFDMRPLEVGNLVGHALEANRGYGEEFDIEFVAEPGGPQVQVYGDFDRLIQVMSNLLSNAAKFSPPGGQVRVAVTQRDQLVRIAVADRGPGIADNFKQQLFERFSQADTSDARQKGGTGLGLSICKAIIERHDGVIGFETEVGAGSTFWFDLPVWHSPALRSEEPAVENRKRILVCDDDPDVAQVLTDVLNEAGYQTDTAYSAEEARKMLTEQNYALMTLDVRLPGQDGISLIRELSRSDRAYRRLPIIVVSGHDDPAKQEIVSGHAVLDWLAKPIDRDRLVLAARRAVRGTNERVKILHVEDDADVRRVLATLVGSDVEVTGAESVAQATSLLDRTAFDLVVLDVGLPDASGLALLSRMEGLNALTPVLVFSAHDPSPELAEQVAAALVKSKTSNRELLDMVRKLVA